MQHVTINVSPVQDHQLIAQFAGEIDNQHHLVYVRISFMIMGLETVSIVTIDVPLVAMGPHVIHAKEIERIQVDFVHVRRDIMIHIQLIQIWHVSLVI